MVQWYKSQGILGTYHIALCTSDHLSVGGRGLFWIQQEHGSDDDARPGDILAYIPSTCVLTCNSRDDDDGGDCIEKRPMRTRTRTSSSLLQSCSSAASWQAKLTAYALQLLRLRNPKEDNYNGTKALDATTTTTAIMNAYEKKEWIQSWLMGDNYNGCQHFLEIKPAHEYSLDQIRVLANSVGMIESQHDTVREALQKRYETFVKDKNSIMNLLHDQHHHKENQSNNDDFSSLSFLLEDVYRLVLSRSASLGPLWNHQRGIIPFHDMINHPPSGKQSNVELFSVAHVCEMIGRDATCDMIRMLTVGEENAKNGYGDATNAANSVLNGLDDKDLLLVATREIHPGDELWLCYKKFAGEQQDPREKLWWTIQYGFPFA